MIIPHPAPSHKCCFNHTIILGSTADMTRAHVTWLSPPSHPPHVQCLPRQIVLDLSPAPAPLPCFCLHSGSSSVLLHAPAVDHGRRGHRLAAATPAGSATELVSGACGLAAPTGGTSTAAARNCSGRCGVSFPWVVFSLFARWWQ